MRTRLLPIGVSVALALAAILVACDKAPTRPSPPPNQNPPPAPAPTVIRIELSGPGTVNLNETAQFAATAILSDASTRDIMSQAVWRSSNSSVIAMSATGLATGRANGEASLSISYGGRSASKSDVVVVPKGTYRLLGSVTDAGVPVVDARVAVSAGAAEGLSAVANGTYRLYGVFGDAEIRVTKNGYEEQKKRLLVNSHQRLDFALELERPRDIVAGTYTLTVTAGGACASLLPEETRVRTYTAVLTQDGPRLTAVLEGAKFYVSGNRTYNRFNGVVEPDRVTFQVNEPYNYYYYYFYFPDVFEQLTTSTYVSWGGSVVTTPSPQGRSGTLNGAIMTMEGPPRFRQLSLCRSTSHRFELSR